MGLLDKKVVKNQNVSTEFSKDELRFLLAKLRSAEYKGTEFEVFFNVYSKIQDLLDKFKD